MRSTGDDVIGFIYSNDKRKQTRRLEKSLILESRQAIVKRSGDLIGSLPVRATFGLPIHVAASPAASFSTEHVQGGPKGSKCQEVDGLPGFVPKMIDNLFNSFTAMLCSGLSGSRRTFSTRDQHKPNKFYGGKIDRRES
jgi:hypothetical protein